MDTEDEILKGLANLIDSWQATVDSTKVFEQNNIERGNERAAQMWRHKYEGFVTAISTLKRFIAGYAAATPPPTPEDEINKYWTDLLEAEAEHHASNYHNIEDFKKIYDAVLHGCKFGFEERQREIDLLEKAHDITIQQLVETQKERNKWKEQCETPTPVKEEGIKSAEEILDKHYQPKMHWKAMNRHNVLIAMYEYANQSNVNGNETKEDILKRLYPNRKFSFTPDEVLTAMEEHANQFRKKEGITGGMMPNGPNDEKCDATGDAHSGAVGQIKTKTTVNQSSYVITGGHVVKGDEDELWKEVISYIEKQEFIRTKYKEVISELKKAYSIKKQA